MSTYNTIHEAWDYRGNIGVKIEIKKNFTCCVVAPLSGKALRVALSSSRGRVVRPGPQSWTMRHGPSGGFSRRLARFDQPWYFIDTNCPSYLQRKRSRFFVGIAHYFRIDFRHLLRTSYRPHLIWIAQAIFKCYELYLLYYRSGRSYSWSPPGWFDGSVTSIFQNTRSPLAEP